MVTSIIKVHQLHILMVLLIAFSSIFDAAGNIKFMFDDIQCEPFNGYAKRTSCSINKVPDVPLLNVDVQMQKEVQSCYIDLLVTAKAANKEPITIFKAERITYCSAQTRVIADPIFMTFKELFRRAGSLPETCPIAADFHYLLQNITIDTELLPSFTPNMGLKIVIVFYDKKIKVFKATTLARISTIKKRSKGRKQ